MTSVENAHMTGYLNKMYGRPGDSFEMYISTSEHCFDAELIRLIHADTNPNGPGWKEESLSVQGAAISEELQGLPRENVPGKTQDYPFGSCAFVDDFIVGEKFTFQAWIQPTFMGGEKTQGIFGLHGANQHLSLNLQNDGKLCLNLQLDDTSNDIVSTQPMSGNRWHLVVVSVDLTERRLQMAVKPMPLLGCEIVMQSENISNQAAGLDTSLRMVLGAEDTEAFNKSRRAVNAFNGKIDSPKFLNRLLTLNEMSMLGDDNYVADDSSLLAYWDMVAQSDSNILPDTSANKFHATTLNRPTRLLAGHNFSGKSTRPFDAPEEFNVVHFHDDDLTDSAWLPSFTFTLPSDLKSGIYAVKLTSEKLTRYITLTVRPSAKATKAKVAVLVPTVSYMVYANTQMSPDVLPPAMVPLVNMDNTMLDGGYTATCGLKSPYDCHTDGSGVNIASALRPQLTSTDPCSRSTFNDSPHQLGSDLYLIDWLEEKGFDYDVISDHDLHFEGVAALEDYRCIITGTHSEYWTSDMLDGLEAYKDQGGRVMYLSGNGLYWVTALNDDGSLAEIRRDQGTRSWSAEIGSAYISVSGEKGGLWLHRGRPPQRAVGVGFSAQGMGPGRPYERTIFSRVDKYAFIFEGIEEEFIGDFPCLVSAYGAAGYEIDRADFGLGTPANAVILARASGFSDCYQFATEEVTATAPFYGGSTWPLVEAHIVYFETPNNGAVFSTGSIAWGSGLSYNQYQNNVSLMTENVLSAFIGDVI